MSQQSCGASGEPARAADSVNVPLHFYPAWQPAPFTGLAPAAFSAQSQGGVLEASVKAQFQLQLQVQLRHEIHEKIRQQFQQQLLRQQQEQVGQQHRRSHEQRHTTAQLQQQILLLQQRQLQQQMTPHAPAVQQQRQQLRDSELSQQLGLQLQQPESQQHVRPHGSNQQQENALRLPAQQQKPQQQLQQQQSAQQQQQQSRQPNPEVQPQQSKQTLSLNKRQSSAEVGPSSSSSSSQDHLIWGNPSSSAPASSKLNSGAPGQDVHVFLQRLARMAPPQHLQDGDFEKMASFHSEPSGLPSKLQKQIWGAPEQSEEPKSVVFFDARRNSLQVDSGCWAQCGICRNWRQVDRDLIATLVPSKHQIFLCQRADQSCQDTPSLMSRCIKVIVQTWRKLPVAPSEQLLHLSPTRSLPQKAEDFDPNHLYVSTPTAPRALPRIGLAAGTTGHIGIGLPIGHGLASPQLLQMPLKQQQPYQSHFQQQQQESGQRLAAAIRIHYGITVTPGWAAAVMAAYQTERPSMGLLDYARIHASKAQASPGPLQGRRASPSRPPRKRKADLKPGAAKRGVKKASLEPVLARITQYAPSKTDMDLVLANIRKLRRQELCQALAGSHQPRRKPDGGWVVNL